MERGGELARIQQVISVVQQGHGGVVVIEAAAGMGKTALLQVVSGAVDMLKSVGL